MNTGKTCLSRQLNNSFPGAVVKTEQLFQTITPVHYPNIAKNHKKKSRIANE